MIQRFRVVTHRGIQFKLATLFVLWFLVFIAIFGFLYFLNFSMMIDRTDLMSIHDRLLTKSLLVDQAIELGIWFGSALIVFVGLVWVYLVVYSHRLTGPIHKLELLLRKSVEEKKVPNFDLNFRKGDAFHGLATDFNRFIEMIRENPQAIDSDVKATGSDQ